MLETLHFSQKVFFWIGIVLICVPPIIFFFILKRKKDSSASVNKNNSKPPLPDWLTGSDIMGQFNISFDMLKQHTLNGLPAYPKDTDIYFTGDEAPPMKKDDIEWLLSGLENEFKLLWFKTAEVQQFMKIKTT